LTLAWTAMLSLTAHARATDEQVVTVAGNGRDVAAAADGVALESSVSQPFGITIGPDGALYVCEVGSHRVRRVDLISGRITTVAGCGRKGYSGDGGPAAAAELNEPYEVRFDSAGNMLFVEMQNHIVRRVDSQSGMISTIAGTGAAGFSGDDGPATVAQLHQPHSIALDAADNIYICDIRNHRIRVVSEATGIISTWSGTGAKSGPADGATVAGSPLHGPRALDIASDGTFWLALREGNAICRTDPEPPRWKHQAGTGRSGYFGDGGPAREAQLAGPKGITLSPSGDVYFADTESHTVRVLRVAQGVVETVIGDGTPGDGPDGSPRSCRLNRPHGVFVSPDGWLYVGDSNNHRVRRLQVEM
jgi:DNA-binding beta-propeller fold protein YncE